MKTAEKLTLVDVVPTSYLLAREFVRIEAIPQPVTSKDARLEGGIITPIEAALHQRFDRAYTLPSDPEKKKDEYDVWLESLKTYQYRASSRTPLAYLPEGLMQVILHPDRDSQFDLPAVLGKIHSYNHEILGPEHVRLFSLSFARAAIQNAVRNSSIATTAATDSLKS